MKLVQSLVLVSMIAAAHCSVQCTSDSGCAPGECCAFVMGRYGSTSCLPLGGHQSSCRPGAKPGNYTVSDPGSSVKVTGVHYMVCPCGIGLECDGGSCEPGLPHGSEGHPAQVPRPY